MFLFLVGINSLFLKENDSIDQRFGYIAYLDYIGMDSSSSNDDGTRLAILSPDVNDKSKETKIILFDVNNQQVLDQRQIAKKMSLANSARVENIF